MTPDSSPPPLHHTVSDGWGRAVEGEFRVFDWLCARYWNPPERISQNFRITKKGKSGNGSINKLIWKTKAENIKYVNQLYAQLISDLQKITTFALFEITPQIQPSCALNGGEREKESARRERGGCERDGKMGKGLTQCQRSRIVVILAVREVVRLSLTLVSAKFPFRISWFKKGGILIIVLTNGRELRHWNYFH